MVWYGARYACLTLLLHHGRRTKTPQHDGDAAPRIALLLLCGQGVDPVLPGDIHCPKSFQGQRRRFSSSVEPELLTVSAEAEHHAVRLQW